MGTTSWRECRRLPSLSLQGFIPGKSIPSATPGDVARTATTPSHQAGRARATLLTRVRFPSRAPVPQQCTHSKHLLCSAPGAAASARRAELPRSPPQPLPPTPPTLLPLPLPPAIPPPPHRQRPPLALAPTLLPPLRMLLSLPAILPLPHRQQHTPPHACADSAYRGACCGAARGVPCSAVPVLPSRRCRKGLLQRRRVSLSA